MKTHHEIRDPIHIFVRIDSADRRAIDSEPVQRLRHIHQLALAFLVYPGASHRRFEHSVGVMELAGRVFDVVTDRRNLKDEVRQLFSEEVDLEDSLLRWRRTVRMAALCHDLGHLPFSHGAEHELLPEGWSHERLSYDLIMSPQMEDTWRKAHVTPAEVAKLAVGRKYAGVALTPWEALLAEIIVGDAFGVDRMDYLLRDRHHTGVPYGHFDQYRLIDTLRILLRPVDSDPEEPQPALGVEAGGLQSAEALSLARYFMYSQVYLHRVRQIYDIHLADFMRAMYGEHAYPTSIEGHLANSDNEVLTEMAKAARDPQAPGHDSARRIIKREHFQLLYERRPKDLQISDEAPNQVFEAVRNEFGDDNVRFREYKGGGGELGFPVLRWDGEVTDSFALSSVLKDIPPVLVGNVFVNPEIVDRAKRWLGEHHDEIVTPVTEGDSD